MADVDRERWDARHEAAGAAEVGPPDGIAEAHVELPASGRALDVACGRGGQTVWLARRGLSVIALDVSPVAVEATVRLASEHAVGQTVDARVADLDDGLPPGLGRFDVIVCQRYRQPDLVADLAEALTPGGRLVASALSVVGAVDPGRFHAPPGELETLVRDAGLEVEHDIEADGLATVIARR